MSRIDNRSTVKTIGTTALVAATLIGCLGSSEVSSTLEPGLTSPCSVAAWYPAPLLAPIRQIIDLINYANKEIGS